MQPARESSLPPQVPRYPVIAAVVAAYGLLMFIWGQLGWQHLGLLVFIWACVSPQEGSRRFIRDWWPMVFFWLSYDAMRSVAPKLFPRVAVREPFEWERSLFISPEGTIWPFYFVRWSARNAESIWTRLLSIYCNAVYLTQLIGIPAILFVLWVRKEELLFRRLVWSLTALHIMTLCIYLAYPAAPPWWVYENGFQRPSLEHSMPMGLERGSTLSGLFQVSPNRFAAIPSLHGAYPLLLTLALGVHGSRVHWIVLAGIYTASMWFACVFLNQHYIIDLLAGALLALIALPVAFRIRKGKNDA